MKTASYVRLHTAVEIIHRVVALKKQTKIHAREGLRRAILDNTLQAYWMPKEAFEGRELISRAEPSTTIPAWTFEFDDAAQVAFMVSYLPIDPRIAIIPEHREQLCVFQREQFKAWFRQCTKADFDKPLPARAHDHGQRLQQTNYRALLQQSWIPLSGALTWANENMAISGQDYVNAILFANNPDEQYRAHSERLRQILEMGREGTLQMLGRPFENNEDDALNDYKILDAADLLEFQRFDCHCDALLPGQGMAHTDFEVVSELQRLRSDGFRDVLVKRSDLVSVFKEKRLTKTSKELDHLKIILDKLFQKDPDISLDKDDFWAIIRQSHPYISRRTFDTGWAEIVPNDRKRPGPKPAKGPRVKATG